MDKKGTQEEILEISFLGRNFGAEIAKLFSVDDSRVQVLHFG